MIPSSLYAFNNSRVGPRNLLNSKVGSTSPCSLTSFLANSTSGSSAIGVSIVNLTSSKSLAFPAVGFVGLGLSFAAPLTGRSMGSAGFSSSKDSVSSFSVCIDEKAVSTLSGVIFKITTIKAMHPKIKILAKPISPI